MEKLIKFMEYVTLKWNGLDEKTRTMVTTGTICFVMGFAWGCIA